MSLTVIELENMEFQAFHGCYELERQVGNRFLVSVRTEAELGEPADSDRIERTINYLDVFETVREQMDIPSHILEHVAGRIAGRIRERFPQSVRVRVKVSKMAPPLGGKIEKVSVTLEKQREEKGC